MGFGGASLTSHISGMDAVYVRESPAPKQPAIRFRKPSILGTWNVRWNLRFAMGSHGLCWRAGSTEVERVSCQARLLGVKPGWSISSLVGKRQWQNGTHEFTLGVGGGFFIFFLFSPRNFGGMIPILRSIFLQMGWNHQLVLEVGMLPSLKLTASSPLNIGWNPKENSPSNHWFSGAKMLVLGRVIDH